MGNVNIKEPEIKEELKNINKTNDNLEMKVHKLAY